MRAFLGRLLLRFERPPAIGVVVWLVLHALSWVVDSRHGLSLRLARDAGGGCYHIRFVPRFQVFLEAPGPVAGMVHHAWIRLYDRGLRHRVWVADFLHHARRFLAMRTWAEQWQIRQQRRAAVAAAHRAERQALGVLFVPDPQERL